MEHVPVPAEARRAAERRVLEGLTKWRKKHRKRAPAGVGQEIARQTFLAMEPAYRRAFVAWLVEDFGSKIAHQVPREQNGSKLRSSRLRPSLRRGSRSRIQPIQVTSVVSGGLPSLGKRR